MKTKLLKKLRRQAIEYTTIERDSDNDIELYFMGHYIRTFVNAHKFISYVTELWHDEAKAYIDEHKPKRKPKRESPYIW